jgi:hypothetical protein
MPRYRFVLDVESDDRMTSTTLRNMRESLQSYARSVLLPKGNGHNAQLAEEQTHHNIHAHNGERHCATCSALSEDGLD